MAAITQKIAFTEMAYKIIYGTENLPLKVGNINIQCYLLENKIPVFVKKSIQKALGYDGKSEDWLLDLFGSINKFYPIPGALFDAYENPILFESTAENGEITILKGVSPEIFQLTCQTICNAKKDGYLSVQQLKHARAASIILDAIVDADLVERVETATGFSFLKETGKNYLSAYFIDHTNDDLWQWCRAIPDEFFEITFELYDLGWADLRNRPKAVGNALYELVFSRLEPNLSEDLRKQKPKRSYRKKKIIPGSNLHPAFSAYLTEVTAAYKAAGGNRTIFIQLLNRMHPQQETELKLSATVDDLLGPAILSDWEMTLKKGLSVNQVYTKKK